MGMSPMEMLDKIRNKAKLDNKEFQNSIAIKMNKPGKLKFQLLALNSENLFKSRTQHFIQTLPDNDDPNEKVMVVDCQGENCPVCAAALSFKNSGVTVDDINDAYNPKYPYPKLRNFLTQPEHFILGIRVLADNADEGSYLPKDAEIGSTQLLQLSKTALSNLMAAYEDFIMDDDDPDSLPPLFGVFENTDTVKSLTINLRVQVQGNWSYIFSFGKGVEVNKADVDVEKLKFLEDTTEPSEDYLEKVLDRIRKIQNYFVGTSTVNNTKKNKTDDDSAPFNLDDIPDGSSSTVTNTDSIDLDDFDLDSL